MFTLKIQNILLKILYIHKCCNIRLLKSYEETDGFLVVQHLPQSGSLCIDVTTKATFSASASRHTFPVAFWPGITFISPRVLHPTFISPRIFLSRPCGFMSSRKSNLLLITWSRSGGPSRAGRNGKMNTMAVANINFYFRAASGYRRLSR